MFGKIIKHKKITISVVLVLIGIFLFFKLQPKTIIPTQTIKKGDIIQSISVSGSIVAKKSVDLIFLVSGKLIYLGVKKGDQVKAYQTIAILDQRTVQKNLEQALLDYSKQRNTFEQTKEDENPNNLTVDNLDLKLKRILYDNQYDLDKSVKSVELQDLVKQQTVLSSPIAGIVTRADALNIGVNIGATSIFSIVDPNSLAFDMDVDEADIGKVNVGEDVTLSLDTYPDENISLKINNIDFASHTTSTGGNVYTVEGSLPQESFTKFRVGMNGNADILISKKENVLIVPLSSLTDNKAYIQTDKGFILKPLKLGLQNDTEAEVLSGLKEGDIIATDPSLASKQAK